MTNSVIMMLICWSQYSQRNWHLKRCNLNRCNPRRYTVRKNESREHFVVSRMEGNEELKSDLLTLYKDPRKNLRALPKVRFEGEQGVGLGPVWEFFICTLKIPQNGIQGEGRAMLYFEGECEHLLPVYNQIVQQMGIFICTKTSQSGWCASMCLILIINKHGDPLFF